MKKRKPSQNPPPPTAPSPPMPPPTVPEAASEAVDVLAFLHRTLGLRVATAWQSLRAEAEWCPQDPEKLSPSHIQTVITHALALQRLLEQREGLREAINATVGLKTAIDACDVASHQEPVLSPKKDAQE